MEEDIYEDTLPSFGQEYNVKDRCQRIGINLQNARYHVGPDRFKWLCLLAMLKLNEGSTQKIFTDEFIDSFFQYIVPKIPKMEYKNALACVLMFFVGIEFETYEHPKFKINKNRLEYIQKTLMIKNDILFQESGIKFIDLIKYIRLFQTIFTRAPDL